MTKTDNRAGVTTNYGYDSIYELLQAAQGGSTTESYSYDPVGNRLSSLGVSSYSVNSSNEVTAAGGVMYTYDYNGNTTSKIDTTGTTRYTWDFENRLTSVTLPGSGGTVTLKYDPFGRRIEKISPTATSIFAYDGDNLVETTNGAGTIISKWAQDQGVDEPLAQSSAGATSYYEADGLGSVTSLTNSGGALAETYTYNSFGKVTASSGSITNAFQYTGRDFDSETNLYYYRARYYDTATGRFLSEDLIRYKDGLSQYMYVLNSPVNFTDPMGLCPWVIHTRPLKHLPQVGDVSHMYLYNTQTGQSVGLGFQGGWPFSAPGKWENKEDPGTTKNDKVFPQPIPDPYCNCVDRHAKNPGAPPHYCLLANPKKPACQNCWNWVLNVIEECAEEYNRSQSK